MPLLPEGEGWDEGEYNQLILFFSPQPSPAGEGATGTPDKAIGRQLAKTQYAKIVLICRDQQKAVLAADQITFLTGNSGVSYELADLSTYQQIHDVAKLYLF